MANMNFESTRTYLQAFEFGKLFIEVLMRRCESLLESVDIGRKTGVTARFRVPGQRKFDAPPERGT